MEKFKTMIGVYKSAVKGVKPMQRQVKALTIWAKGASAILRDARNPHPGMRSGGE